jgi:hypothetical protein
VAYLFAVFLGLLVAVFVGYVEWWVLHRCCSKILRLSSFNEYKRQWYAYIDSLEKAHNSYVTKQVIAFHFQARTGLALLVLALALCICPLNVGSLPIWISLVAAFLLVSAIYDHWMLAQFRNRRFALRPDATARPEDTLRSLVNAWCQRCATRPLQSVLPLMSADRSWNFPTMKSPPEEKGMLYPVIAALGANSGPCKSAHRTSERYRTRTTLSAAGPAASYVSSADTAHACAAKRLMQGNHGRLSLPPTCDHSDNR